MRLLEIVGWNSWGEMVVMIRGRRYSYRGVSAELYDRLCGLLRHRNNSAVFKILRRLR